MSLFLIPELLCAELERLMNSFWWGSGSDLKKGVRWKAWDRLCAPKSQGGMGFRKLHLFNLALLAKQGWRLLTCPDSLVAQVYKARYYPTSSFLEAKLKDSPSFLWRSLLAAQNLVISGARRLVGSGTDIKIWEDPWLPNNLIPYIESLVPDSMVLINVSDLMNSSGRGWNHSLLHQFFSERDRDLVKQIPLSRRSVPDSWYWVHEKRGNFSVRSGYKELLRQSQFHPNDADTLWCKVWKLNVPPKIKNLVWRSLSSCLPTLSALQARHIPAINVCPLCAIHEESVFHILVDCVSAKQVWILSDLGDISGLVINIREFWELIFASKSAAIADQAVVLSWAIWCNRNSQVWDNKILSADAIFNNNLAFLSRWKLAQIHNSVKPNSPPLPSIWSPPPRDALKCNVDASIFEAHNQTGFGFLIRDHSGACLEAKNGLLPFFSSDSSMTESLSIREALSWIKDRGHRNVVVETDSLVAVHSINNQATTVSPFGLVIADCKSLLKDLDCVSIVYVKRSANFAAHSLARVANSESDRGVWGSVPPPFLVEILRAEQ